MICLIIRFILSHPNEEKTIYIDTTFFNVLIDGR